MSNFGLEKAFQEEDIPFVRAAVGDRYVLSELQARAWKLGGESSGHILCLDITSTGDGIISALQVIAAMERSGESLHVLKAKMTKYPQLMINVNCKQGTSFESVEPVNRALKETEAALDGTGRVLLRPSGTEPVIRVMVEGEDLALVEELAKNLAKVVEQAMG